MFVARCPSLLNLFDALSLVEPNRGNLVIQSRRVRGPSENRHVFSVLLHVIAIIFVRRLSCACVEQSEFRHLKMPPSLATGFYHDQLLRCYFSGYVGGRVIERDVQYMYTITCLQLRQVPGLGGSKMNRKYC